MMGSHRVRIYGLIFHMCEDYGTDSRSHVRVSAKPILHICARFRTKSVTSVEQSTCNSVYLQMC